MSVAMQLSERCLDFRYETLSPAVREMTKRVVADALCCAIGGYKSPTGRVAREFASLSSGSPQATLIGLNTRVSCSSAIIANHAMLRYLDYNDAAIVPIGPGVMPGTHPSGSIPVALAVCEMAGRDGRDLMTAIVAGYEVIGCLLSSFRVSLEGRGFHNGCVHAYAGAAIAGKLLGLSGEQLAHAMGISGSLSVGVDILDAEGEEYTMAKNLADGMIAERGYVAAELARRGMTGPLRIIEGNKGFAKSVLGAQTNFEWTEPKEPTPFILQTFVKTFCAEATTHGHLYCTAGLAADYDIAPADIESIVIRTSKRSVFHTGDPVKKYPRNKETADHSSYFLTAMAVINRKITPEIYNEANYTSPDVRAVIDRIVLEHGPEFDNEIPAASVTVRLRDGRILSRSVDRATLKALETRAPEELLRTKFAECVGGVLSDRRIEGLIDACLNLDAVTDIRSLLALTHID